MAKWRRKYSVDPVIIGGPGGRRLTPAESRRFNRVRIPNKTMKLKTLLAAIGVIAVTGYSQAQTPTNSTPWGTILGYFTSFDTNLDDAFGSHRVTLWTGVTSIQNGPVPLANDLGASYDLFRPSGLVTATNDFANAQGFVGIEGLARNSGVAGTLVSFQGGLEGGFIIHDTRLAAYADGGYATDQPGFKHSIFAEAGIDVKKAIGHNFFAGLRLGQQFGGGRTGQIVSATAGVPF